MKNEVILKMKHIRKTFHGVVALDDVHLELRKGEVHMLLGENGAGKSTLLKILSTILAPTEGEVYIDDINIYKNSHEIRSRIGFVSHEPFLYENLSALENLVFFAGLYNVDNPLNKAKEILETLQLDARENELVRNYSRGMKQRVALARALIHEPDILYLDEPFSGLDLLGTSIITNILKNLKAQGKTILMSTHSFDDCADLAHRILLLINGEIAFMTSDVNKDHFKQKYLELVSINN